MQARQTDEDADEEDNPPEEGDELQYLLVYGIISRSRIIPRAG